MRDFWTEVSNADANDAIAAVLDRAIHLAQSEDAETQPAPIESTLVESAQTNASQSAAGAA